MKVSEIKAKHIIIKSKLPDSDYVVNPYTGCEFGCIYCYASFMGRFVNEPIENWGNYVYVKTNAVELFKKELPSIPKNSTIFLSSVTDAYQGVEAKYKLTRGVLEEIAARQYPGPVSIQTKSMMVTRDIDILKKIPDIEVGMTVTTTDDELGRFMELRATAASMRIETLKKLNEAGIRTFAFVGPLFPHFRYKPELLDKLFADLAESGTKELYVEHINLSPYIKKRMFSFLEGHGDLQTIYGGADTEEHRKALDKIVGGLVSKYGLKLRLGGTMYHKEWMKEKKN